MQIRLPEYWLGIESNGRESGRARPLAWKGRGASILLILLRQACSRSTLAS